MTDQPYEPEVWVDDDGITDGTEFTADRMNHIEGGLGSAASAGVGGVLSGNLPMPGLASGLVAGALGGVFVGVSDPRLSDSRPPSGAASGALDGSYPNPDVNVNVAGQQLAARLSAPPRLWMTTEATLAGRRALQAGSRPSGPNLLTTAGVGVNQDTQLHDFLQPGFTPGAGFITLDFLPKGYLRAVIAARKTAGTATVQLLAQFYVRSTSSEVTLATTPISSALDGTLREIDLSTYLDTETRLFGRRLGVRIIARVANDGTAPTVELSMQGADDSFSRVEYPVQQLPSLVAQASALVGGSFIGFPAGGILSGTYPNPGLSSAVAGSALASGVGPVNNRRLYLETGAGAASANAVRMSWGSGAVAEIYGVASDGSTIWSPSSGGVDLFGSDSSANYVERSGGAILSVWSWDTAAGLLKPIGSGAIQRTLTWNVAGIAYDHRLDMHINKPSPSDGGPRAVRWILKWIDANNYLYLEYDEAGNGFTQVWEYRGGVRTKLNDLSGSFTNWLPDSATRWARGQIQGNVVSWAAWANGADPATDAPSATATYTLTGTPASVFGALVQGRCGPGASTNSVGQPTKPFFDQIRHSTLLVTQNQLRVRVKNTSGVYLDRLLLDGLGRTDLAGVLGL